VAPAHIASFCGHVETIRTLHELGADLSQPPPSLNGSLNCPISLFSHDGISDAREEHGATPLFIGAANNQAFPPCLIPHFFIKHDL